MAIEYVEPPELKQGDRRALNEMIEAAQARPGQWVRQRRRHRSAAQSFAHNLRKRPGFEATSRGSDVYARYVGADDG